MKAVIQAGGKGTRVSSITGNKIPKPMLEVDGYPILYHQIMNLKKSNITDIVLIVGYLGEVIEQYFGDGKKLGVHIDYFRENPDYPLGTAGALYYLKNTIKDDFVFLLADIFIDVDFIKMKKFHDDNNADVTLFTHPNSHPYDSDLVVVDSSNVVSGFDYKTNDRSKYDYHNVVNAGIMIFSPIVFRYLKEEKKYNYEKDIIFPLIKDGRVLSYKSTEYARDMGTPERYEKIKNDYFSGYTATRNLFNPQKCIFLDRDGTINQHVGFLKSKDQFQLLPGVVEAIKKINGSDYLCIVVTNQPVIARGEASFQDLDDIHKRFETILGENGAYVDDIYFCPHHPDKGFIGERPELKFDCDCRKPKIGMIEKARDKYNIDLNNSYMIGDSTIDIQLAINANMHSILVHTGEGGKDGRYPVFPEEEALNLEGAVDKILKKSRRKVK